MQRTVLIICLLVATAVHGQRLHLRVYQQATADSMTVAQPELARSFSNYKRLNTYADSLFTTVQRKAFLAATYRLQQENDTLYSQFIIKNKPQPYVRLSIPDPLLLAGTRLGSSLSRKRNTLTLPTAGIDSVLTTTHQELLEAGQLFNSLRLKDLVATHADTLTATLHITTDTPRRLDRLVIKGYDEFPKNLTKNLLPKRSPVTKKTLDALQNTLAAIPFTSQTKTPEFLFKKDSTLLYIYLKKENNNSAEGFLGFNNDNGQTTLTGNLDLRLLNNLHRGEQLAITYRADDNKQRLIESTLLLPYLFESKIGATASINLLRRDTIYQNNRFKAGLFYKPTWNTDIGLNLLSNTSIATGTGSTAVTDLRSTGVQATYGYVRSTADKLQPINTRLQLRAGYAARRIDNGTATPQYLLGFQGTKIWNVLPKGTVYVNANAQVLASDDVQFNELYQLGGEQTIRGFRENSIDTRVYGVIQTELRYTLGSNFYGYTIADLGQFEDFNTKEPVNLYALGGGVGILTQTGILRISLANGSFDQLNLQYANIIAHIRFTVLF